MSNSSSKKGKDDKKEKNVRKTMIMPADTWEDAETLAEEQPAQWEEVSAPPPKSAEPSGDRVNRGDRADFNQTLVDGKLPASSNRRKPQQRRGKQTKRPASQDKRRQQQGKQPSQRRRPSGGRSGAPPPPGIRHPSERPKPRQQRQAAPPRPQEKIAVSLAPGGVRLDPGETERVEIYLENLGPVHGNFTIKVKCKTDGIRTELSQTLVSINPGARSTVGLTIHVPKSSSILAGQHEYQVVVGSNQSRKQVGAAEGRITVTPYERFSFEIAPAKVRNNNSTQITISNEGNAPVRYRVDGRDQSAIIDFEIPESVIEIEPGETQKVPAKMSAQSQVWLGKEERHPYEIRVSTTAGEKKTQRGTLIVPPRISYLYAGIAGALLLVLLIFGISRAGRNLSLEQAQLICTNVRWLPNDIKSFAVGACRRVRTLEAFQRDANNVQQQLGANGNTTGDAATDTDATGATENATTGDAVTGDQNATDATGDGGDAGESELVLTAPTTESEAAETDDDTNSSDDDANEDSVTVVDTSGGDDSNDNPLAAVDWEPQSAEIGSSPSGTTIESTQLGDGPNVIAIIGGIHSGFAPSTVQIPNQISDYFKANPTEIPENSALHILPNLNIDSPALVRDRNGRFNSNGVDLNRNFDCNWTPNAVVMGQTISGSGGSSPLSELEALAVERWINDIQPRAVIVLGASAPTPEIAAGGCNGATPESINLAEAIAGATGYFVDNSSKVTGDVTDWLASRDYPSVFILLSDHVDPSIDFSGVLSGVKVVLDVYQ